MIGNFILFLLPWLDNSKVRSARFRPIYKQMFWILLVDCILLGMVGAHAPNDKVFPGVEWFEYVRLGQITTAYYFFHFLVLMPLLARYEKTRPLPESISEPVLGNRSEAGE